MKYVYMLFFQYFFTIAQGYSLAFCTEIQVGR